MKNIRENSEWDWTNDSSNHEHVAKKILDSVPDANRIRLSGRGNTISLLSKFLDTANFKDLKVFIEYISNLSYEIGSDNGVDTGYQEGFSDGRNEGYDEGYENGYDEGRDEGYEYGFDEGLGEGEWRCEDRIEEEIKEMGEEHYDEGYKDGYHKGLEYGYGEYLKDMDDSVDFGYDDEDFEDH